MFECNICLEAAAEPVVTRCGHLFCWACLHQWLNAPQSSQEAAGLGGIMGGGYSSSSGQRSSPGSVCPLCKASVTAQNVIPVYARGGHRADPRNGVHPDLPARPPGERPEPEPASVAAMQTFAHGGVPESYGYSAGQGYFPFVFGLNLQGASLREAPAMCKKTSYMLVGLSFCYAFTLFLL
mmetsp:Transcript_40904/g.131547  ORF Transcript_40904/g.131547 Transcript_40904/m.131547 type:complete len:181 (+) Transcript_40904:81-623(+)